MLPFQLVHNTLQVLVFCFVQLLKLCDRRVAILHSHFLKSQQQQNKAFSSLNK